MKNKFMIHHTLIIILLVCMCLILAGCPAPVDKSAIKNGEAFKRELEVNLHYMYGVEFADSDEEIIIDYIGIDGTNKTATFELDGYDASKMIGYKTVLNKDVTEWEQSRKNGDISSPDIREIETIQYNAALYEFPIIFISAYEYQDEKDSNQAIDNFQLFRDSLDRILDMPELRQWSEKGLYNGDWVKERIQESYSDSIYKLDFSNGHDITVEVSYGDNELVIFKLDGYDAEKKVGYKFVTADDEKEWNNRSAEGNKNVPDLTKSDLIKQSALEYEFPVLFIYYPEYWKTTINQIIRPDNEEMIVLKRWLKIDS